jgi:hypothetical protein
MGGAVAWEKTIHHRHPASAAASPPPPLRKGSASAGLPLRKAAA